MVKHPLDGYGFTTSDGRDVRVFVDGDHGFLLDNAFKASTRISQEESVSLATGSENHRVIRDGDNFFRLDFRFTASNYSDNLATFSRVNDYDPGKENGTFSADTPSEILRLLYEICPHGKAPTGVLTNWNTLEDVRTFDADDVASVASVRAVIDRLVLRWEYCRDRGDGQNQHFNPREPFFSVLDYFANNPKLYNFPALCERESITAYDVWEFSSCQISALVDEVLSALDVDEDSPLLDLPEFQVFDTLSHAERDTLAQLGERDSGSCEPIVDVLKKRIELSDSRDSLDMAKRATDSTSRRIHLAFAVGCTASVRAVAKKDKCSHSAIEQADFIISRVIENTNLDNWVDDWVSVVLLFERVSQLCPEFLPQWTTMFNNFVRAGYEKDTKITSETDRMRAVMKRDKSQYEVFLALASYLIYSTWVIATNIGIKQALSKIEQSRAIELIESLTSLDAVKESNIILRDKETTGSNKFLNRRGLRESESSLQERVTRLFDAICSQVGSTYRSPELCTPRVLRLTTSQTMRFLAEKQYEWASVVPAVCSHIERTEKAKNSEFRVTAKTVKDVIKHLEIVRHEHPEVPLSLGARLLDFSRVLDL